MKRLLVGLVAFVSVLMLVSAVAAPAMAQNHESVTGSSDDGVDRPSSDVSTVERGAIETTTRATDASTDQNWPMKGYGPANTGYDPAALAPTAAPQEEWTFNVSVDHVDGGVKTHTTGIDRRNVGQSSPTIVDGTAYFGDANGRNNYVYAVDVSTGTLEWRFHTGGFGNSDVRTTPAVEDGRVYVGDEDGKLWVLDAETGQEQYNIDIGTDTRSDQINTPTVADGTVYFGSDQSKLYAYDGTSGVVEWVFEMGSNTIQTAPAVEDGYVYATTSGYHDQRLYKIDVQTGQEEWNRTVMDAETSSDSLQAPVVTNGHVYVGDQVSGYLSGGANLHAYDADTGEEAWTFNTGEELHAAPAVAGCTVYVGDNGGDLYAVDAGDGTEQWQSTLPGRVTSSPSVANGHVYVGDDSGQLHAIDASNGVRSWGSRLDGRILTSPTPSDGDLYVGGAEELYAISGDVADRRGDASDGSMPCDQEEPDNEGPDAVVTATPSPAPPGEAVTFDAADSTDSDGEIVTYEWDFVGDETVDATTTEPTVTHSFEAAGDYTVNLTVIDETDATATATTTVTVEADTANESGTNGGSDDDGDLGDDNESDDTATPPDEGQPGMGIVPALASLASVAFVLARRFDGTT